MTESLTGHESPQGAAADNRKRLVALGGVVAAVALAGGVAWAATSFFATGAQPSEALPSSTIAYASVDLDPSGGQKIEAIRTLRKFPAFNEELGLDTDDDLRETLFEELVSSDESCSGLDFESDVAPWLGSRAGIAAVDAGEPDPSPVLVVQVTDPDKAEEGIRKLVESCGGDAAAASPTSGSWIVTGDWAVAGETREIVQNVVDATGDESLAQDADFQRWTEEAGDPGIASFYVAREAAAYFDDVTASGRDLFGMGQELGSEPPGDTVTEAVENFEGLAMTIRFDGGALEVETAASANQDMQEFFASSTGVDLVASLPSDTVAAFGLGMQDGWFSKFAEQIVLADDEYGSVEDFFQQGSEETGLDLPEDVEAMFGEGVAMGLGSGIDVDAFFNGGPMELPIGVKIKGDVDEIEAVLDKIEPQLGPDETGLLDVSAGDGYLALGPDAEFRDAMVKDGNLGDDDVFKNVVEGADDAQSVFFVNFNADDDWLVRASGDADPEVTENLEPLAAFGVSSWFDDGVAHALVKLTTD